MSRASSIRFAKKYAKRHLLKVTVSFNDKFQPELKEWIASKPNRAAYLRGLVERDYFDSMNKAAEETKRGEKEV